MIDVDNFKAVNDTYGHPVGDHALRIVAGTLRAGTRRYDRVGRWGGEEFLVVLPGSGPAEALIVAERLRQGVADTRVPLPDGDVLHLGMSLGVANVHPGSPTSLDGVLRQADDALYRAKRLGRNRVEPAGEAVVGELVSGRA